MIQNHVINSSDIFILVHYTKSVSCVPGVRVGVEYPTGSEEVKPILPIATVKRQSEENSFSLEY